MRKAQLHQVASYYRHGLRASELVDLRWDQVDFRTASLHVRRVKQGTPNASHALLRLQREQEPKSPFVFTSDIYHRRLRPDGRASRV